MSIEYYLIDKNGSFLCVNSDGKKQVLVVHTERSLKKWLEIYGDEEDCDQSLLADVASHKKIPFFGVGLEAFNSEPEKWQDHFYMPSVLEGREKYFWVGVEL